MMLPLMMVTFLASVLMCSGCGKLCREKHMNKALRKQIEVLGEDLIDCLVKMPHQPETPLALGKDMPEYIFEQDPQNYLVQAFLRNQLYTLIHQMKKDIKLCQALEIEQTQYVDDNNDVDNEEEEEKEGEDNSVSDEDASGEAEKEDSKPDAASSDEDDPVLFEVTLPKILKEKEKTKSKDGEFRHDEKNELLVVGGGEKEDKITNEETKSTTVNRLGLHGWEIHPAKHEKNNLRKQGKKKVQNRLSKAIKTIRAKRKDHLKWAHRIYKVFS